MGISEHFEKAREEIKEKLHDEDSGSEETSGFDQVESQNLDIEGIKSATDFNSDSSAGQSPDDANQPHRDEENEQSSDQNTEEPSEKRDQLQEMEQRLKNTSEKAGRDKKDSNSQEVQPEQSLGGREGRGNPSPSESELEGRIKHLENKINKMEMRQQNSAVSDLRERIQELNEELNEVEEVARSSDNDILEERLEQIEETLTEPGENVENLISDALREEISDNLDHMEELSSSVENMKSRLDEQSKRIQDLSETVAKLEEESLSESSSSGDNRKLKEEIDRIQADLDQEALELNRKINQNQDEIKDITQNLVELSKMVKKSLDSQ